MSTAPSVKLVHTIGSIAAVAAVMAACTVSAPATAAPSVAAALAPIDTSQHLRIMPLGDSITAGVGSSTGDSYRWELTKYVTEVGRYTTADFVGSQTSGQGPDPQNEGHSGWKIYQLAAQAKGWVTTYQPDVVLVHAGINDARYGATPEVMRDRMNYLLHEILTASPSVRVVVSEVLPTWNGVQSDDASATVQRFNGMLPGIVAVQGPRVSLAKMSAVVPSNLLPDGVHPGDTGYRYMAWTWWRCMAPLLSADGVTNAGKNPLPLPLPQSAMCG